MRFSKVSSLLTVAAVGFQLGFAAPASAQSNNCLSGSEAQAEQVRRLKTTLMVGALQCSHAPHLKVTERYNAFVETHASLIKDQNDVLAGYFKRVHGKAHRRAMDRHVTSTANKVATQSYKTAGFCEKIAVLAERSLGQSPQLLVSIAGTNTLAPSTLKTCAPANVQAAGAQIIN